MRVNMILVWKLLINPFCVKLYPILLLCRPDNAKKKKIRTVKMIYTALKLK